MGATIRTLRKEAGLSQLAFGARIWMHHNYVGTIERGAVPNPGLETVDRIAVGLGVSIAVLATSFATPTDDALSQLGAARRTPTRRRRDPKEAARALGTAIRALRGSRGLTQSDLADATEVHRSHLASIEAGEKPNPGIGTIARIARGLQREQDETSPLPQLTQIFTGELTVAELCATVAAETSGSPGAEPVPQAGPGI